MDAIRELRDLANQVLNLNMRKNQAIYDDIELTAAQKKEIDRKIAEAVKKIKEKINMLGGNK